MKILKKKKDISSRIGKMNENGIINAAESTRLTGKT